MRLGLRLQFNLGAQFRRSGAYRVRLEEMRKTVIVRSQLEHQSRMAIAVTQNVANCPEDEQREHCSLEQCAGARGIASARVEHRQPIEQRLGFLLEFRPQRPLAKERQ